MSSYSPQKPHLFGRREMHSSREGGDSWYSWHTTPMGSNGVSHGISHSTSGSSATSLTASLVAYHSAKKEYQETAKVPEGFNRESLDRGFNTSGLWAYSRHPNFAAEQSGWVLLYGWSCWVTQTYYNWTIIGAVAYLILFQASTWFTELISAKKYPEYKEYQKRVGKFLPKLPGGPPGDFRDKLEKKTVVK